MKILCCFVRRSLQSPQAHGALGGERGELSGGREPGRVLAMCKTCAGKAEASLSFRSVGPEDAENPFQQGGARGGVLLCALYINLLKEVSPDPVARNLTEAFCLVSCTLSLCRPWLPCGTLRMSAHVRGRQCFQLFHDVANNDNSSGPRCIAQ